MPSILCSQAYYYLSVYIFITVITFIIVKLFQLGFLSLIVCFTFICLAVTG